MEEEHAPMFVTMYQNTRRTVPVCGNEFPKPNFNNLIFNIRLVIPAGIFTDLERPTKF
jgi:hypothetical protein